MLKPEQPFLTKCTVVPVDGDSVSVQKEIFTEKGKLFTLYHIWNNKNFLLIIVGHANDICLLVRILWIYF